MSMEAIDDTKTKQDFAHETVNKKINIVDEENADNGENHITKRG